MVTLIVIFLIAFAFVIGKLFMPSTKPVVTCIDNGTDFKIRYKQRLVLIEFGEDDVPTYIWKDDIERITIPKGLDPTTISEIMELHETSELVKLLFRFDSPNNSFDVRLFDKDNMKDLLEVRFKLYAFINAQ